MNTSDSVPESIPDPVVDLIPPKVRTYIYGLVDPVSKLVAAYGIIEDSKVALWVGLAGSLLGMGAAIAYRPTSTGPTRTGQGARWS